VALGGDPFDDNVGLPGLRPFEIARDEYLGALVAADDVSVDG